MFKRRSFAKARRHVPGQMNGTEAEYSAVLELRKRAGEIDSHEFERLTFKLAPDLRYTPDFMVVLSDGLIEFHEVKGSMKVRSKVVEIGRTAKVKPRMEDDARAKYLMAAERFPQFRFALAYKVDGKFQVDYAN